MYRVTRERIRQLEDKAYVKIKGLKILKDFDDFYKSSLPLPINDDSILFKKGMSYIPERTEIAKEVYKVSGNDWASFSKIFIETALLNGYTTKHLDNISIRKIFNDIITPSCTIKNKKENKTLKTESQLNTFSNTKQQKILSIKEIVTIIIDLEPYIVNNDRALCQTFDEIALTEGYTNETLPSYWTILRAVYDYKKDKNITIDKEQSRTDINYKIDLDDPIAKHFVFNNMPTTKEIVRAILKNHEYFASNDRYFCKLFDLITVKNGYNQEKLPKYWNIIRALYDCKKEAKFIKLNQPI